MRRSEVGGGHVDLAVESLLDETRKKPGMVHVGVRHQHEFDRVGIVDVDVPVALVDLRVALMHPAVDRKPSASRLQNETGAGHRSCRTHTLYFHRRLTICMERNLREGARWRFLSFPRVPLEPFLRFPGKRAEARFACPYRNGSGIATGHALFFS